VSVVVGAGAKGPYTMAKKKPAAKKAPATKAAKKGKK
jgi:hypothetical protein